MAIHVLPWTVRVTLDSKVEARPDMALLNITPKLNINLICSFDTNGTPYSKAPFTTSSIKRTLNASYLSHDQYIHFHIFHCISTWRATEGLPFLSTQDAGSSHHVL